MFKDRTFNLSILFSVCWHLFWIVLIGIIVTPAVQTSDVYQEVVFLGPILEKTAFDLMVEGVKPQAETLYSRTAVYLDRIYLKPEGPSRKVSKEFIPDAILNRFSFSLRDYFKDKKDTPLYFAEDIRIARFDELSEREEPASVQGPAKEREIIFKPDGPTVPRGLYSDVDTYTVRLKFFISNNGIVYDVEPVVSSGSPGIDLEALRFLKRWRFSPDNLENKDKSAWGVVTVEVVGK
ncbi:MAG: energy transducer TonB [Candidatus Omnitrophota bacterium]